MGKWLFETFGGLSSRPVERIIPGDHGAGLAGYNADGIAWAEAANMETWQ